MHSRSASICYMKFSEFTRGYGMSWGKDFFALCCVSLLQVLVDLPTFFNFCTIVPMSVKQHWSMWVNKCNESTRYVLHHSTTNLRVYFVRYTVAASQASLDSFVGVTTLMTKPRRPDVSYLTWYGWRFSSVLTHVYECYVGATQEALLL